jgi:hypothetical protein
MVLLHRCMRGLAVASLLLVLLGGRMVNASSNYVLGSRTRAVSATELQQNIDALYAQYPAILSFVSQSVSYTPQSVAVVLRKCTQPGAQSGAEAQSGRLMACAPLIYFFYSFGQQRAVPDATQLADELYSFAVTDVKGPIDPRAALHGLLSSWGIPVASGG